MVYFVYQGNKYVVKDHSTSFCGGPFSHVELPGGVTLEVIGVGVTKLNQGFSPTKFMPVDACFEEGYQPPQAELVEEGVEEPELVEFSGG